MLIAVLILGGLAVNHYIGIYGWNVLPDGITVAIGDTAYAAAAFAQYFFVMFWVVVSLTALPKANDAEETNQKE